MRHVCVGLTLLTQLIKHTKQLLQMCSECDTRTDIVFRTDANIPQEVEINVWHLRYRKINGNQAEEIERKRRNPHSKKKD